MEIIKADIVDYLGKYENGVIVLLSLFYKDSFSEATLYYSSENLVFTVDPEIEKDLGQIELWEGYRDLMESILKRVVPYNEIYNRLDDIDLSKYQEEMEDIIVEEIDKSDIKTDL